MALILPKRYFGPILTLSLPKYEKAVNLVVTNVTTGKTMMIEVPALAAALDVELDFTAKTVIDSHGVSRSAWVSADDDGLWVPNPMIEGANEVQIEAFEAAEGTEGQTAIASPAIAENNASFGTLGWISPANAEVLNGAYATCEASKIHGGETSQYLAALNFAFVDLPAGSTPKGIEVFVVRAGYLSEITSTVDIHARIVKGGVIQATERAIAGAWSAVPTNVSYGGPADLFGLPWTAADLKGAGFGFALAVEFVGTTSGLTPRASVDAITARVTYNYLPAAATYGADARVSWRTAYA